MKRFALTTALRNDSAAIQAYEDHHARVWPEVQADMARCGVVSTYIYRLGQRLFMLIETVDEFDLNTYRACLSHPETQKWQALMDSYMEAQPQSAVGLRWTPMREVCAIEFDPPRKAGH